MALAFEEIQRLAARLDRSGMLDLVGSFPSQMKDAQAVGGEFARKVNKAPVRGVVVCGMGGSAIGGDMVRCFLGDRLSVPLYVNREYTVPRYLVPDAFFVFSSYSGNTAETLSAYRSVRAAGRPAVAITSGGELARLCAQDGVPVCEIPGGMPPRAAIAFSFFPLLHILAALGVAEVDARESDEARRKLEEICRRYRTGDPSNFAIDLANRLAGTVPVVYASAGLLEAVARRWSNQINENGKALAHFALFPELTHNEIVGWSDKGGFGDRIVIVRLTDVDDGAEAARQADIAMELIEPHCAGVVRISGLEGGRLTRILSTIILGDFVSVYLALVNGVDPTPVESIDTLKRRVREAH